MEDTKYGKYFIAYEGEQKYPLGEVLARFDDSLVKGSNFYFLHWMMPGVDLTADEFTIGHPPHSHQAPELLFHIGTNPEDPTDLGAELEITIGEEMEKHVITKTTIIFIPANVLHGPFRPVSIQRPFIFLQVNQEPKQTSTFYPELMPEEQRGKVDWKMWEEKARL
jgi:hypothetical protein